MTKTSGPTGKYPHGRLTTREDRGELVVSFRVNAKQRIVEIDFGTELTWIGLRAEEAQAMGERLIQIAGELRRIV